MRGADLGLTAVFCLAGAIALVGLAIFPPGKLAGVYPTLTGWGPPAVVAFGVLGLWCVAGASVLAGWARPLPIGEVIFESDGGFVALGLALIPLAVGPWFLAAAVDQIGRYGPSGVFWGFVCLVAGLGLGIAGFTLGYARDEVRLGDGMVTVIAGRGLPSIRTYAVKDVALEVTKVVVPTRTASWKVELVTDGQRLVVGRTSTLAEAEALVLRIRSGR